MKARVSSAFGSDMVLPAQQVRLATPDEVEAFDLFLQEQELHVVPQRGYFDLREPLAPVFEESEPPGTVGAGPGVSGVGPGKDRLWVNWCSPILRCCTTGELPESLLCCCRQNLKQ